MQSNKFIFCHIGWSARWLSQTVFVFKLAYNGLQIGDVAGSEALNYQAITKV